ncbi:transcriptional repressor AgaR [Psychrobium sp. 1_MG-2023]|uniref:transcriptional repressor AgaR n=1 Tax=Psychrobium sp. 1_MG-2023 TaxID=3062624 RepID=UPI000C328965|nr:transcriptional repressor AgaR [Psychrobium sp. 1_MG-2023]MDP2560751.1 transcriptional repressor AgaR [Psychrobium sp. 1_MG-2023]PKF56644.1 DeoR family transcriptional regulator [Alteromonadales bacterium alter-6D02]
MNTIKRRHDIVQLALSEGKVFVNDLVSRFGYSAVTIRSDLNYLHKKGLLIRARGGAIASNRISQELSVDEKLHKNVHIKRRLAQSVCELIDEGDAIILDSGTTTEEVAKCLASFRRLVVMTNGLNIAQNLLHSDDFEVMMTGGTLRKTSMSFYGRQAEDSIERYYFDKVILGVDGIDFNSGITTHFEYEAILNRTMCDVAKEVIVVTDSSKFNRAGIHKICGFDQIDTFVTDSKIPDAFAQTLEKSGVKLIIA